MHQKPFVITIVGPESSGKTTLARQLAGQYACPWVPEYAREYLEGLGRSYTVKDLEVIAEGQLDSISKVLFEHSSVLPPDPLILQLRSATAGVKPNPELKDSDEQSEILPIRPLMIRLPSVTGDAKANEGLIFSIGQLNHGVLPFLREEIIDPQRQMVIVDSGMLSLRMWARIKYGKTIPLVEEAMKEDVTSLYLLTRPMDNWEADPLREAPTLLDRAWIYNQYLHELSIIQSRQSTSA